MIVGTNAGLTKQDYEKLSALAPTIAQSGDYSDYFEPWDVQHLAIGKALGKEAEAIEQVDSIKADFAAAAEEHPEFEGTPAVFLQNAFYDGSAIAYQDGSEHDFLTDLGFVVPKELDEYADGGGQAYIPMENLDVLNNADVLLWATEKDSDRTDLEKEAVYRNLDAVKGGNLAFTDEVLAGAIYFTSPLSLPYVLDELVPKLATAVEGDPSLAPRVRAAQRRFAIPRADVIALGSSMDGDRTAARRDGCRRGRGSGGRARRSAVGGRAAERRLGRAGGRHLRGSG